MSPSLEEYESQNTERNYTEDKLEEVTGLIPFSSTSSNKKVQFLDDFGSSPRVNSNKNPKFFEAYGRQNVQKTPTPINKVVHFEIDQ